MSPNVHFGAVPAASQKCGDLDKLSKLQAKLRQYRTANRAQAQEIADLTGPGMPCVAFGLPLCAGCKDFHAQAECEKGLLQALGERTHELKDLRDLQRAQEVTLDSRIDDVSSSIDAWKWHLEHAQDHLDGKNLLLRYKVHWQDLLLLDEAFVHRNEELYMQFCKV